MRIRHRPIQTGTGTMNTRRMTITLAAAALLTVATTPAQDPCAIGWRPPVRVSSDSSVSTLPGMALAGDTVHLTWFGLDTTALGTLAQSGLRYARSIDGGATFGAPVKLLSPFESLPGMIAAGEGRVFITAGAILDTFFGTVVLASDDGGVTWNSPEPLLASAWPEFIAVRGAQVFIGFREVESASFGILASDDAGGSWRIAARRIRELSMVAASDGVLYGIGPTPGASQTEAGFYRSADSGRTWSGPSIVSPEDLVRSSSPRLAVGGRGFLHAAWTDTGAIHVRSSRNAGASWAGWTRLSSGAGNVSAVVGAAREFVAVAWDRDLGGVRGIRMAISNDHGGTWCPSTAPAGGDSAREPALAVADSTAHLAWIDEPGGRGGVFYRRGSLPGNPGADGSPPSSFALRQSYPNPTNGTAVIEFDLPAAADVTLELFNVLGELVMELPARRYGPGRYAEHLEVGRLASGVYLYRLSAAGFAGTGRMVVLR